jgi:hypothetical protein
MEKTDLQKLKALQEHYLNKEEIDVFMYMKISLVNNWIIPQEIYNLFTSLYNKYENSN